MSETNDVLGARSLDTQARCFAWACQQLGVKPSDSLDAVRQAFWSRVDRDEMSPSRDVVAAFEQLHLASSSDADGELPHEFLLSEEKRLADEVETFARDMLQMPIAARRARWNKLNEQCQLAPRVLARLTYLSPGLSVDRARIAPDDGDAARLASELCTLFTAPVAMRAKCRSRIRELWKNDDKRRYATAKRFARKYPRFAALAPEMMDELREHPKSRQRIENWKEEFPFNTRRREEARQDGQQTKSGAWLGLLLPLLWVIILIVSALSDSHKRDTEDRSRQRERERIHMETMENLRRLQERQDREDFWRRFENGSAPSIKETLERLERINPKASPLVRDALSEPVSPPAATE